MGERGRGEDEKRTGGERRESDLGCCSLLSVVIFCLKLD
jgi:hypothetical protein